jgi:glycosyltransferase involved in cell wall biosynthesis
MTPKVSIVIPAYNHAIYLKKCIESALNQTYSNIEIIVVNDASTDNTKELVSSMQKKDSRIRYLENSQNLGICVTEARGCMAARGKFIAILDADTFFYPEKIEKQVNYLTSHPKTGAVFSLCDLFEQEGNPFTDETNPYYSVFLKQNKSRNEWLRYFFNHGNGLCHPSILMRKRLYRKIRGYNAALLQMGDFDLYFQILTHSDIHIILEPLVGFIITGYNTSTITDVIHLRLQKEYASIMRNYENLRPDLYQKVFPEFAAYSHDKCLILFKMACLGLQCIDHGRRVWAVQTIEKLIQCPASRDHLLNLFGFGPKQYYKILTDINPYSLHHYKSCLHIDSGNGYDMDWAHFCCISNKDGPFELIFDRLSQCENILSVRWMIVLESPFSITLSNLKIEWKDKHGSIFINEMNIRHSGYEENNTLVFLNPGPIIEFEAKDAVWIKIHGNIQYSKQ